MQRKWEKLLKWTPQQLDALEEWAEARKSLAEAQLVRMCTGSEQESSEDEDEEPSGMEMVDELSLGDGAYGGSTAQDWLLDYEDPCTAGGDAFSVPFDPLPMSNSFSHLWQ